MGRKKRSVKPNVHHLLGALQLNSYKSFVSIGNANFQAKTTPQMVDGVSRQISPRMGRGFKAQFLGKLEGLDFDVYLWKLSFKDKKGDRLAELYIQNGAVHAFYIR